MRMVVTVPDARVYGKVMQPGDEFDCPEKEARLWQALARAKPADGLMTTALDLGVADEPAANERPGRTRYRRRDMRADS